jgi:hypothetical protein
MRMLIVAGLAGVALVSLAACNKHTASGDAAASSGASVASAPAIPAGPVTLQSIPHRKPGLWSQTMTMTGQPGPMPSLQICVDAASEAKTSLLVQQNHDNKCGAPQLTRNLDGSITFTTSCDMGAIGKIATSGTVKGDFNSAYTVDMTSVTTGGAAGASETRHITLAATRTGDCAPGQTGGDIILANGMKLNALRHAAMAAHPPGQGE